VALNQIGLLDERLYMFGYDIDLSFRIRLGRVIKITISQKLISSTSTHQLKSKFSWDYIRQFYGAMIIFATKYLLHMPELKMPGIPQLFAPKYEIER
jgi:GT2 family glycosyltransferase